MANKFVSFLKQAGLDAVKVLGMAEKGEKIIKPYVIAALPASTVAFNIADEIFAISHVVEKDFALVNQASNGPAKVDAAVLAGGDLIDQWIQSKLPGSSKLVDAEKYLASKKNFASAIVDMENCYSAPAEVTAATLSIEQIIAAQAAKAAAAVPAKA